MYTQIILAWAKYINVPGTLLLAICTHESGLKNIINENDGGSPSYGICQIKESTARESGFKGKESDLMKPEVNVLYAAKYLAKQLNRYNGDWTMAISAYNAGSYRESTGRPGCPRNMVYVDKIQRLLPYTTEVTLK